MPARKTSISPGMTLILRALEDSDVPLSIHDLADKLDMKKGTITQYCWRMSKDEVIHVVERKPNHTRNTTPFYAPGAGIGVTVKKPRPKWASDADRSRDYYRRVGRAKRIYKLHVQPGAPMLAVLARMGSKT